MKQGFIKSKVKDAGKVFSGATPRTENQDFWNGNILWITPNDLSKHKTAYFSDTERKITTSGLISCSVHLMPANSIVMSTRAPIGYLGIGKKEFTTNQGCKSIALNKGNDPLFFYYNLKSYVEKLKQLGEGTTFAEITKSYLEEFEVTYPSSEYEQKCIAEILSTADEAIEQTENLIDKYLLIKTGLMQDLLTRGIDEHGNIRSKATHKFVVKNGIEVPEEWKVRSLKEICSVIQDGTHFSPHIDENGEYMYLTSKNIRLGYLDLSDVQFINAFEHRKIFNNCQVEEGDVLLTKDGANTGNASLNTLKEEFSLLSSVCLLRGKDKLLINEYLLYWLLSENGYRMIRDSMSGLAITRITLVIINGFKIPLPPYKEQVIICKKIKSIYSYINLLVAQLTKLNSLKIGLMQDLLSGRVRVKIVEGKYDEAQFKISN
jgi:type I restriction enzyme, S subunit